MKKIKNYIFEKLANFSIDRIDNTPDVKDLDKLTVKVRTREEIDADDTITDRQKLIESIAISTPIDDFEKGFENVLDRTEKTVALYDLICAGLLELEQEDRVQLTINIGEILNKDIRDMLYRHILLDSTKKQLVLIQQEVEKFYTITRH